MPYEITKPRSDVIVVDMIGELSIDDLDQLNKEVVVDYATNDSVSYYIVYKVGELKKFPTDISALRRVSEPISSHKGIEIQIITGVQNRIFNFLLNIIGQMFKQTLVKRDTLEEAFDFIEKAKQP
ncbi:MAG: hypothetical protein ACFE0Q_11090 [Anaerolineae bacterium]